MMSNTAMTRRWFFKILAGFGPLVLARTIPSVHGIRGGRTVAPGDLKMVASFASAESASPVGRAYLECHPREQDIEYLLDRICPPAVSGPLSHLRQEEVLAFIRERIRDDFTAGRTVMVRRWLLSETEARLYALVALLN